AGVLQWLVEADMSKYQATSKGPHYSSDGTPKVTAQESSYNA
mgnify:CR=1